MQVDGLLKGFPMAYSLDLSVRVALITGASGGLGAQLAGALGSAAVMLGSRRPEKNKPLRVRDRNLQRLYGAAPGPAVIVIEC